MYIYTYICIYIYIYTYNAVYTYIHMFALRLSVYFNQFLE